jgi:hypothetical protein
LFALPINEQQMRVVPKVKKLHIPLVYGWMKTRIIGPHVSCITGSTTILSILKYIVFLSGFNQHADCTEGWFLKNSNTVLAADR